MNEDPYSQYVFEHEEKYPQTLWKWNWRQDIERHKWAVDEFIRRHKWVPGPYSLRDKNLLEEIKQEWEWRPFELIPPMSREEFFQQQEQINSFLTPNPLRFRLKLDSLTDQDVFDLEDKMDTDNERRTQSIVNYILKPETEEFPNIDESILPTLDYTIDDDQFHHAFEMDQDDQPIKRIKLTPQSSFDDPNIQYHVIEDSDDSNESTLSIEPIEDLDNLYEYDYMNDYNNRLRRLRRINYWYNKNIRRL